jgi:hypothetical protein
MVPEAEAEGHKARILGWKQQLKKGVDGGQRVMVSPHTPRPLR